MLIASYFAVIKLLIPRKIKRERIIRSICFMCHADHLDVGIDMQLFVNVSDMLALFQYCNAEKTLLSNLLYKYYFQAKIIICRKILLSR
jgi:hypothetical protein